MGNFRAKKVIVSAADVVSRSNWYIALHQRYTLRFNLVGCLKVYMPSAEVHQTYIAVCMSASYARWFSLAKPIQYRHV